MDSHQLNTILNLSFEEKLRLVQQLWNNISSEQSKIKIPEEHKVLLMQRIKKIKDGDISFINWDEIKKKYLS